MVLQLYASVKLANIIVWLDGCPAVSFPDGGWASTEVPSDRGAGREGPARVGGRGEGRQGSWGNGAGKGESRHFQERQSDI